jgi:hypothetical protein
MYNISYLYAFMKRPLPLVAAIVLLAACAQNSRPEAEPPLKVAAPPAPPPAPPPAAPAVAPADAGYVHLFNGKDLTGWGYPNGARFDGLTEVPGDDKRFKVVDGLLTVYARTPQQRTLELRTTANFTGDFMLKLEFRAGPRADSGIFLRGRQLQCRDYSTMGPYRTLTKYKPQDWNEVEITVRGDTALCTCNGEVLEPAMPVPANGGIGLESDGGIMEYRNIRLKLMP